MMHGFLSAAARPLLGLVAIMAGLAACGGGGGDAPSGPAAVATVEVTAPSPTLEVGGIMIVSARAFDAAHKPLSGRTATWVSSNPAVATVTNGSVTGVTAGSASITATIDGKSGSVTVTVIPVAVASIVFSPANPAVRQGETLALTAQPVDAVGRPLSGRPVTWSTANAGIATVNATTGVVTGISPGSVYIRGETEGKRDSVQLRVKSLNAPAITGTSQTQLVPGATGTVTGTNFGALPNDNQVFVNGAPAAITAASATSVSFTVPPVTALPCTPTGPAQIMLVANADTATATMSLAMATPRTLAVGQSMLLTSEADLRCNEFSATGGKYLFTAFNYATNAGVKTSFKLLGASTSGVASVAASAPRVTGGAPSLAATSPDELRLARHFRAHLELQRQEREMMRRMGNPRLPQRMRRSRESQAMLNLAAVNPPPALGSTATFRMRKSFETVSTYDDVTFRAVYVGSKIILYEDTQAPLANTMDQEYQRIGQEFDNVMFPLLENFGNPLVVDSALDNNGHLIALFSQRVNTYTIQGVSNAILGFVTLCDFFPRVPIVIGGQTIPACPSSNEAEAFYAIVPNPSATSGAISLTTWRRFIRGTLIHEAKHITSYAERYYREANVEDLEEIWLEEATAQQASEMWARTIYARQQRTDIGWNDGPRCDYAAVGGACPDPAEGILHHFSFLYEHYDALESKSILDDPAKPVDPVVYGSAWSFARWLTDLQPNEGTFLRSIVQVQNDHGVQNVVSKSGKPWHELLGLWSLASLADNYPGAVITDDRLKLPSWNSRDLFAQMSAQLRFSDGSLAFPRPWPMNVRQVSFGTFQSGQSDVTALPGGGFAAWELAGVQSAPQVLAVRGTDGGPPPSLIGMAIVRIQ